MKDETSIRFEKNAFGSFYTTGRCMAHDAHVSEAVDLLALLEMAMCETYFIKQTETAEEIERDCCAPEICYIANSKKF